MQENFGAFERCVRKAEALKKKMRVALVCPDEGVARVALRAKARGLAEPVAFGMEPIEGMQTQLAGSPQEAAENALELCVKGGADTVMKGLLNTNTFLKTVVRSSFRTSYLTHCSILDIEGFGHPIVVSDGTVTPFPDLSQKIEITKNAVRCARLLERAPVKVAVLSANELVLPGIPSGSDARELSRMAGEGAIPEAVVDGPIALDSALSKEACEKKGLRFAFTPPADVLICPDLESAAMLIKAAVYLAKACVAGLLWGARRPIVLTSRADSEESKYVSLCLCKLAMEEE